MINSDFVVYRMYDEMGRLLYVGQSINSRQRMYDHSVSKDWWRDIENVRFERFETRAEMRAAEALAIRTEHPIHNVIGHSLRKQIETIGREIDKVYQTRPGTSLRSIYDIYWPPEWCTPREFEIVHAMAERDLLAAKRIRSGVPVDEAFDLIDQKFWT